MGCAASHDAANRGRERASVEAGRWAPRFNCVITWKDVTSVGVFATVQTETRTRKVSVPFLTVSDTVQTGEELILQVEPKPTKEKRKRTWRDIAKEEAKVETDKSTRFKGNTGDDPE